MGRHSAPEDDETSAVLSAAPATATAVDTGNDIANGTGVGLVRGRHELPGDSDSDTVADAGGGSVTTSPSKPRTESGTHGDLRLLRERPALRARCAAAAIVPFLLYTAVLAVIGRADIYLLWVWIPTVTAGVAVGGLLDAAHRHDRKQPVE